MENRFTEEMLLSYTSDNFDSEIGLGEDNLVEVVCCDGTVKTRRRLLIAAWPYLIMNIDWKVPITVNQIPREDEIPTGDFHFKYMDFALAYAYDYFNGEIPLPKLSISGSYSLDAQINFTIRSLEGYGLTIDTEDVLELLYHPFIVESRGKLRDVLKGRGTDEQKSAAINATYKEVFDWVKSVAIKELPRNGIIQHVLADAAKKDQFLLLIVAIGYTAEINSSLFNTPIVESIAEGVQYDYSFVTNLVGSSRAMMYSKNPIEDTETLNRVLQMQAAEIRNVHVGDCGSQITFPAKVTARNHHAMIGMFFLDNEKKLVEVTKKNSRESIGKIRSMRFNAGCKIDDPNGCCSVCGGAATLSVVEHANVGHLKLVTIIGTVSQLVLKAKHAELMTVGVRPFIEPQLNEYFDISSNNRNIILGEGTPDITITFVAQASKDKLRVKELHGSLLHTVRNVKDIRSTNLGNYSAIDNISIAPNDASSGGNVVDRVSLNKESRLPFSYDILEYIRDNPGKLQLSLAKGMIYRYSLNLDAFERGKPVFQLPFQNFDIFMQYRGVKRFMSSPAAHLPGEALSDYNTMGEAAMALLDMTIDKLNIDLGTILFSIWPFSVQSVRERKFNAVKGSNECQFLPVERLYNERSIAPKILFTGQGDTLGKLRSVTHTDRSSHIYDPLFTQAQ